MSKAAISAFVAATVLCVASCGREPASSGPPLVLTVGSIATIRGVVTGVDMEAMVVDGPGLVHLREGGGAELTLVLPAGEMLCMAEGMSLIGSLKSGDTVEAVGAVETGNRILICNKDHALRRLTDPG